MAGTRVDPSCSIARSLSVIGQPWTMLILREAFFDVTRFVDFRARLGIAPDVLTDRLNTLVEAGVMRREPYRERGERTRDAYLLTPAGRELHTVLLALQQWGDEHVPHPASPSMLRRSRIDGRPVHVGYVDDAGRVLDDADVEVVRSTAA
ncbi:MAG TPA: helix-turn-helix domain-containing protein [Micromonosporaceae bacterium]|jgi:DNA-binding HxlR family transcriptional regulator